MTNLLLVLGAIAVVAAIEGARQLLRWSTERKGEELRRRLQAIGEVGGDSNTLLRQGKFAATPAIDGLLRKLPLSLRIEKLLEQADSSYTVAQIMAWSIVCACGGFLGASMLRAGLAVTLLLVVLGLVLPSMFLLIGRDRRSAKLSEQLPEALDMMSRSLRAGHALTSAFEIVASEMPDPVSVEFGRAFEAQRLGLSVDQAIVQMTQRAPGNRDLKIFAVSALIQKETGGNLAEILANIAETIRARYRFFGKLRALTAEGRASGLVLGILPIAMVFVLRVINPTFLVPLIAEPLGRIFLAYAIFSWMVGIFWLYSLTKVDI